jgi:phospho-N-acetylmuramoyl-pentapeptide-transferase
MIANLLAELYPYQIFRSVFFRAAMGFLTAYFLTTAFMPLFISYLQRNFFVADIPIENKKPTPIMGGIIIVISLVVSTLLWVWVNFYIIACLCFLVGFALIGFVDDYLKVKNYKKILAGASKKKSYSNKTDGMSGSLRLLLEFAITAAILGCTIYFYQTPSTSLQIPMVPLKNWHPALPYTVYFLLVCFMIVGCANAVNLMDGLDTLVSIPIVNSLIFIAAVSYIVGDIEWANRLKIYFLSEDLKELSIFSIIMVGGCVAFLKYNTPPAYIYMGDVGSLGLGAAISALFLFTKAELFLPIVGGVFVIAAFSVIVQRVWFFFALKLRGRKYAEKNRFFFRAPYHHHQQAAMDPDPMGIRSIYQGWLKKLRITSNYNLEKNFTKKEIDSKVIWQNHIRSIWFLVIAFLIYFKIR